MKTLSIILSALAILAFLTVPASRADELTVSAASSLTGAFGEISAAFETANPGVRVILNFGSSGVLVTQLAQGAPVDLFASADEETMDLAAGKGIIDTATRTEFASNELVMIVPVDSAAGLESADGLLRPGIERVAVGNPETVPAGQYAKGWLQRRGLWGRLGGKLVYAENVRQVLDYVRRGEVDAGFVYTTDALARSGDVRVASELPLTGTPVVYTAAAVKGCHSARLAAGFLKFLSSEKGRAILAGYGFGPVAR